MILNNRSDFHPPALRLASTAIENRPKAGSMGTGSQFGPTSDKIPALPVLQIASVLYVPSGLSNLAPWGQVLSLVQIRTNCLTPSGHTHEVCRRVVRCESKFPTWPSVDVHALIGACSTIISLVISELKVDDSFWARFRKDASFWRSSTDSPMERSRSAMPCAGISTSWSTVSRRVCAWPRCVHCPSKA